MRGRLAPRREEEEFLRCGTAPRGPAASCLDGVAVNHASRAHGPIQKLMSEDRLIRVLDASIFERAGSARQWISAIGGPTLRRTGDHRLEFGWTERRLPFARNMRGRPCPRSFLALRARSPPSRRGQVAAEHASWSIQLRTGMRLRCARRKANRGPRPSRPSRQRSAPAQQEADRQS